MKSLVQHLQESLQVNESNNSENWDDYLDIITKKSKKHEIQPKDDEYPKSVEFTMKNGKEFTMWLDNKDKVGIQKNFGNSETLHDFTEKQLLSFINESVNESSEITSDEQFIEYGEKMLKAAHGEDYDKEKADDTLKGILKDADGDYGQAVGTLQTSMSENLNESQKVKV